MSPPEQEGGSAKPTDGTNACSVSIFDTRINWSWMVLLPDEGSTRLADPAVHPEQSLCRSFAGKSSCCNEDTLKKFGTWSKAMTSVKELEQYMMETILLHPTRALDFILFSIRARVNDPDSIDWSSIRDKATENANALIADICKQFLPVILKSFSAYMHYREGLLCSACEPNFERYLDFNAKELKMKAPAALAVAEAEIHGLGEMDIFLSQPQNVARIKAVARAICDPIIGADACSTVVMTIVGQFINDLTGVSLRQALCGATEGSLQELDEMCKKFILNDVLSGLNVDLTLVLANLIDFQSLKCRQRYPMLNCSEITRQIGRDILNGYFTFDRRPRVHNLYVDDGFDVLDAACKSHLSGFPCDDSTLPPSPSGDSADSADSGPNALAIVSIVIMLLLVIAVVVKSRHRFVGAGQRVLGYARLREHEVAEPNSAV